MILDTNAVSALLAGDEELGEVLKGESRHHLPVVVIGEYRYGLRRSRHRERLEPILDLLVRESVVLLVDEQTAEQFATVRDELRENGTQIPENDVWISALGRQHGLSIVSRDSHFDLVPQLIRRSW